MAQRDMHPLDVDLYSFALGEIDATIPGDTTEHLEECLLCRVRVARFRANGVFRVEAVAGATGPVVSSGVLEVLNRPPSRAEPHIGQVWLAGDVNRILVWVAAVARDAVVVHPVTVDIQSADESCVLVDPLPVLGGPGAVVTSIIQTVPVQALGRLLGSLDIGDQVRAVIEATGAGLQASGVQTGRPITGVTDERLEVRQLLADSLAMLDPIDDEADTDDSPPEGPQTHILQTLVDELRSRRPPHCDVRSVIEDPFLGGLASALECAPVAIVTEVASVLVIAGEDRCKLTAEQEDDAAKLLSLARTQVLAICDPYPPFDACLYETTHVHMARELPRAMNPVAPRPMWERRPLVYALCDYLEEGLIPLEVVQSVPGDSRRDLAPLLRRSSETRIHALRASRAQLTKNTALKSLTDSDAADVAAALASVEGEDLDASLEGIADR